jgi:DNA-binding transcriptional LysR family regulator
MLRQLEYFQAVVRCNSFSEAAEECHISQSAISQQVKALEDALGVQLLHRQSRKFELTPAGEHFYKKSLVLVADYERLCGETVRIARRNCAELHIGYLKSYGGRELQLAIGEFSAKYPDVEIQIMSGNHEDLYAALRSEAVDLVLNDQRRAFSDEYINLPLIQSKCYVEIAARNPIAAMPAVTLADLKNTPCILIASKEQQQVESEYYRSVMGFGGEFVFAENLEEARLLIVRNSGFMPIEGVAKTAEEDRSIVRLPLFRGDSQMTRCYCAFWRQDNSGYYVEEFADILKSEFEHED